jgi:hypothetical protein
MVIVQELLSSWGKNLRSAGELRTSIIPKVLPIPVDNSEVSSQPQIIHHSVAYLGENQFAPSDAKVQKSDGDIPILFRSGAILLRTHQNHPHIIAVKFKWSVEVGAPKRADRHIANLEPEQWLQIIYNGRTGMSGTGHADWRYLQHTVNIAVTDKVDANIFIATAPNYRFEDLAQLR